MSNRRRLGLRLPVPDDLWIEILVSLPVKSLLRFQCVSKSWKSIISSPTFISMHAHHSESTHNHAHHLLHCYAYQEDGVMDMQYQLFHINDSFNEFQKLEYPCQISGGSYKVVLDCKRLLLFAPLVRKNGLASLVLWNPAIRMSMTLSQPYKFDRTDRKYLIYGFGFDHTSSDYKVLRMVLIAELGSRLSMPPFPSHAELYKLRTGTWETVRIAEDFQYTIANSRQALVNGASHWVGYHKRDMGSDFPELVVLLFHMCDEEFRVMKLPACLSSLDEHFTTIGVSGGFLSLLEDNSQDANVWLMKEYGVVESWTKQLTLKDGGLVWPMFSFWNNKMILDLKKRKGSMGLLYDLKTHKLIKNLRIRSDKVNGSLHANNTFVETLVLLNEVHAIRECENCVKKDLWCGSEKIEEEKRKNCLRGEG
ncbi:F-box/kelch-repeat protein At3g23880-like [Corylus avellana]|uniref:F-box/kelch-repeat protein At3g23880-like n=1 Tax=Corylus avellana TaxID=13451 RepID=UPI00286AC3FD|nr:F-box/kelch-repeat protein At3g23880-like [Corylus avellana]